jgi:hypothetical protein
MKKYTITLAVLLLTCGIASAEMLSGTVTNIDPTSRMITLQRDGSSEELKVIVSDMSSLSKVKEGTAVKLEANKAAGGEWTAGTVEPASGGSAEKTNTSASSPASPAPVSGASPADSFSAKAAPSTPGGSSSSKPSAAAEANNPSTI